MARYDSEWDNQNQMNMNDLPLLINTTPANPMNYNYQNLLLKNQNYFV